MSCVVEAVPETKAKTLYVVTAFIGEPGYKKGTQQLIDAQSPNATPKVGSAEVPVSSISDPTENVNRKYLEAVKAGDMETAQRMVEKAAARAGYSTSEDWRMQDRGRFFV